jgi:hypothetical protein
VLLWGSYFKPNRPWLAGVIVTTTAALAWSFRGYLAEGRWPGGSSLPGFVFGVLGGLIIVFECLLWLRKRFRSVRRFGRAQDWLRAHVWLGLLCVPLAVLHTGFHWGGPLSATLLTLFLVVIASGVWGLVMQQWLPRRLLLDVPAETIYEHIEIVMGQQADEATALLDSLVEAAENEPAGAGEGAYLTVGAVRSAGGVQGKVLQTLVPGAAVPGAEQLREFFAIAVNPYLRGAGRASPLANATTAARIFREQKSRLDLAAHEYLDFLENLCEQRRQLGVQARLHFWLHNWLWVHVPLSAALLALLGLHVWVALKYW